MSPCPPCSLIYLAALVLDFSNCCNRRLRSLRWSHDSELPVNSRSVPLLLTFILNPKTVLKSAISMLVPTSQSVTPMISSSSVTETLRLFSQRQSRPIPLKSLARPLCSAAAFA
ncbi:hypothetical protein R3P38DRAFT_1251491 [Favolaschia claudopus]|uniref:Secreted protein n=1 Tax=Favolaschia claudopus TaxID=2862362 RepID=A0AAW0B2A2_9AGAR